MDTVTLKASAQIASGYNNVVRIFTNVKKQMYPDIKRISLPLLRNNQFSLKFIGQNVPSVEVRVNLQIPSLDCFCKDKHLQLQ